MGVFGAFFGCIGDGGFNGCCSGARSGDDGSMLACISGRRGVIGFKVPMGGVLRAKKFALRGLMVGASAKKFALHAQNTPKSAFLRLLGEFFRGNAAGGSVLGEFFAPIGPAHRSCGRRGARGWLRWGFCSIRSWLAACRRRVVPLVTPFPPFGDGPAEPSAASARAPSRRTSPRKARRRSLTTTSSRRRRNMSAALDRLKQQNEPE